jgi:hypothetical protein
MTASNITTPSLSSKVDPEVKRAIQTLIMHLKQVAEETAAISAGGDTNTEIVATVDEETVMQAVETALEGVELFTPDYTIPVAPTGLIATGGFNQILLEWNAVPYKYVGHYEIFRNTTDNQGTAVKIGTTQATIYVDIPPDSALQTVYYYWVRAINKWDATIIGAFNATSGTSGSTADDPNYILQIAAEKWQASYDYDAGDLTMPTIPNGYCYEVTVDGGSSGSSEPTWPTEIDQTVTDGDLTWKCKAGFSFEQYFKLALVDGSPRLTLKDLYLADGIIKNAMIGSLAVDNAKMANVSVSKLLAGIIEASGIYVGASSQIHIDGINEKITVNDGTYDRVVIGKLASGWGLEVYNASGDVILNSGGVYASMVSGLGSLALLSQLDNASYIASALIEDGHIKDYIKSTDYNGSIDGSSPGTAGWIINKAAMAVFNNIYARGDVEASSLKANTLMVNEGNINNLQVTTLKIGDNAVTIPVSGYNASQQTWSRNTNNEVISATITTYGQPIFLWFSFVQTGAAGTLPEGRIYRDSTIIWDSGSVGDLSIEYLESWQIQITDAPRSGTYTYKLTMNPGGTTAGAKWRNVLLLGLRK